MHIDWLKLAPALLLLLTPIGLFHGRGVRFRSVPSSFDGYWSRILALGLHWIDLGRAILGGWLLVAALSPTTELQDSTTLALTPAQITVLATQAGVLLAALLLQTFVCREEEAANPPLAFALGLALGFLPPTSASFALFVAIVVGFGFRSVSAFFPVLALTLVGAGALFSGKKLIYGHAAIGLVMFAPTLFTLLFPRHFVVAYAPTKTAAADEEPPHR